MSGFFDFLSARFSRAPLSFGLVCIALGMILADTLNNGFGLSSLAVGNIGATIGLVGVIFFQSNCKAERTCASPQEDKAGKPPVE